MKHHGKKSRMKQEKSKEINIKSLVKLKLRFTTFCKNKVGLVTSGNHDSKSNAADLNPGDIKIELAHVFCTRTSI